MHPNQLRFAAPTGTDLMRWDGARKPVVWTVPPPTVDPGDARLELARRARPSVPQCLRSTTPDSFVKWAGIAGRGGDAHFLLHGDDRALLVPYSEHRSALRTPRVWPDAVMVKGEIVGTWRGSRNKLGIETWRRLTHSDRGVIEAEATPLPLPEI